MRKPWSANEKPESGHVINNQTRQATWRKLITYPDIVQITASKVKCLTKWWNKNNNLTKHYIWIYCFYQMPVFLNIYSILTSIAKQQCSTITRLHLTAMHNFAFHCTVLYCTVSYYTVSYWSVLFFTVLYCTFIYCIKMHCTML